MGLFYDGWEMKTCYDGLLYIHRINIQISSNLLAKVNPFIHGTLFLPRSSFDFDCVHNVCGYDDRLSTAAYCFHVSESEKNHAL